MRLAGIPVQAEAVAELATTVRVIGADDLADRLEAALDDGVALLALRIDERAIILAALEDPPDGLTELRAVADQRASVAATRGLQADPGFSGRSITRDHVRGYSRDLGPPSLDASRCSGT